MPATGLNFRQQFRHHVGSYLTRETVILALLAGLALVCFAGVTGLSRLYHAQQESLGNRWFSRGVVDLNGQRFDRAVVEFRSALVYSRDDYAYQLNLAEALMGLKRTGEAYAYLINLWDRQPEDGLVNLELARIAAQQGQTEQALRYYHNAVYATWSDDGSGSTSDNLSRDQEVRRRDTRLELIEFLLKINAKTQAQSELIALAENVGDDGAQQAHIGDLFVRAQDYEHALAGYRVSLKSNRHNATALAGAGLAAFELGRYDVARPYLQGAAGANSDDTQSADRLKTVELVLRIDPFRAGVSAGQRDQAVLEDFAAAGERITSCSGSSASLPDLSESWVKMKPQITLAGLRRDPDLVNKAMAVVFGSERQTSASCGSPTGMDLALLLIARLHEGN